MKELKNFTALPEPISLTEQNWPEGTVPLVTTRTMTYMHESFIRQCIEGILMQRTTFPVQILIHDDASTDQTTGILREYEERYPGLVSVFYQPRNTYRDPNRNELWSEFMSWIEGKYLALCEGDDYWTDPLKLQKQVEFLEANPGYALTFHNAVVIYAEGTDWKAKHRYSDFNWCHIDFSRDTYTGDDFLRDLNPPTASIVYRISEQSRVYESWLHAVPSGDIPLFSKVVGTEKAKFFNFDGSVYRKHAGGVTAGHRGDYIHVGRIVTYLGLFSFHKGRFAGTTAATIRRHLDQIKDRDNLCQHPFFEKLYREIRPTVDQLETGHSFRDLYGELGELLGEPRLSRCSCDAVFVVHGPNQINGPNVWLQRLLPELKARGIHVHVLAFMTGSARCSFISAFEALGITCKHLPFGYTEKNVVAILEYLKEVDCQMFVPNLNVPGYYAAKWVKAAGIPTVGVLHSDDRFHHDIIDTFASRQKAPVLSDLVVVSKLLEEKASERVDPTCRIHRIPYGAPVPTESTQFSDQPFRLVYAGRFVEQQKQITQTLSALIQLAELRPNIEVTLCGSGPLKEVMEKMIQQAQLTDRIFIRDSLNQEQLREEFLRSQAFVLLSDYEGLPIALQEAMAVGVVPICKEVESGVEELVIDGETGFICKDRDADFISKALNLMDKPKIWEACSTRARSHIEDNFNSARNAESWAKLIIELGESKRANPGAGLVEIPSFDRLNLPPPCIDPSGIAREDRRMIAGLEAFQNPPLDPDNADLYWQRRSILEAIHGHAALFEGRFLDVGCGLMPYRELLRKKSRNIEEYIGMDIQTDIYKADVDLRWDGQKIPMEDHSIDSAMATEVLEHCPEPLVVLKEIRRVLKPGGVFFFTVPYIWPLHDAPYDFYRYTPFSLKKLLSEAGFDGADVKALSGWDASLAQMMGLWLKRAPMSNERRNAMAQKLWPLYQELIQTDQLPADSEAGNTMTTGWRGIAFKPAAQAPVEAIASTELPLIIVRSHKHNYSETFIEDHVDYISRKRILIYGWPLPRFDESGHSVLEAGLEQAIATALRANQPLTPELQQSYQKGIAQFIRKSGAKVALLENGLIGAMWFEACLQAELPYVIHFHGVDAFGSDILKNYAPFYRRMFTKAAAVVGVSLEMVEQLKSLGADPSRLVHGPYGVSVELERIATPAEAKPIFVAVGRFVDKKSPQNTLRAFGAIHKKIPGARLIMVGDGPLLEPCRRWVQEQNLGNAVTFAGVQSRQAVSRLMSMSRVFVQHSVCAENGDREGLPLAVLEAGAHGLPVVATRHAGIPDAVREGVDGFLVDEGDAVGMAKAMLKLAGDAELSGRMGATFRQRVCQYYSRAIAIQRLQTLLAGVIEHTETNPNTRAESTESAPTATQDLESRIQELRTANAAWTLAQEAIAAKQPELAFSAAEVAVGLDRNFTPAYLFMGQQLAAQGAYEEAYLCFNEAARVGRIPEQAEQMLRAMDDNPELQTESIQTYRDSVSADDYTRSEKPRRILVFTNLLPPQEMGGFGRSVWELCDGLIKRGHEVLILTADVKELQQAPYPNYERVERHVERTLQLFGHWKNGGAAVLDDPEKIQKTAFSNVEVILKAVKRFRPDVCMAGNLDFVGGLVLEPILDKKIPVVHRLGNEVPGYPVEMLPRSELFCLAGCSHWVNAQLEKAGYHPAHFACLPPGSPLHEYYRLIPPRTDRLRICYAGLMMGYKGPHLILEALHMLKKLKIPFSCEFAGDFKGEEFKAQFEQLIQQWELGEHVRVLGFCNRKELGAMYARSNVLVMPSIFEEPFGKVQIEAQAAGLAVVRTPVGGYQDMLEDEVNGLLFKCEDPQDLARQLYVLNEKHDFWQRLAARGQADAFRFTTRNSVHILEQLFEELLDLATKSEKTTESKPMDSDNEATNSPEIWDRAGMRDRLAEDDELIGEVLQQFLNDLPEQVAKLEELIRLGDLPGIARQAHSVKGMAATAGAEALRAQTYELEEAGEAGDLATAQSLLASLQPLQEKTHRVIMEDQPNR